MPIDPRRWGAEIAEAAQTSLKQALIEGGFYTYLGLWHSVTSRYPVGTNIYDREWDVLIVLDACRVDALREVANEYEFVSHVDTITSLGSGSHEWMARTFTHEYAREIDDTTYTTPNGFAEVLFIDGEHPPRHPAPIGSVRENAVQAGDFGMLDVTWEFSPDDELEITPPRFMTDRAIHIGREYSPERLIVHYYQPHLPHIANAVTPGRKLTDVERNPWESHNTGVSTREEIWSNYLDNLRLVLEEVELLLNNIDAERVAITADHGDLIGEWGLHGHPESFPHPKLRCVPWVETSATDSQTHTPKVEHTESIGMDDNYETSSEDIEERLSALGYR